ncbi:response regulator [Chryseosolibacter indicus]|uniref:Response regulator n=1 Tax=Chryseosolibacter indicus TaxID=2782351 RepID=A0ABS5VXQ3_9BACT|nr:response regulator [Chryseosolibacter indicus]MBT1704776.1 response regulator [Chryseosolibacter indicus]
MGDGFSKKVLIIDDDSRNIFALKAVLKSKGMEVLTASGALEGINQLTEQNNVGIVLLDMMMPEMDGYEAIGLIRQGRYKYVPIISVTAQAMVGDKEKCLEAGADAYISKPINVDELLILLKQYLK